MRLKNAKELGDNSLMLVVHPTLSINEIDRMCLAVRKVMELAQLDN